MLKSLRIRNYALIDHLEVDFQEGFTTITGETGAGKSILLGGLSMILGKRADLSSLRDPESKCVLEAVFHVEAYQLEDFFEEEDLDYEVETVIRREILPSGKSRAFVNDTPVTLQSLSALGQRLVDIHSQHQTLQLTDNKFQFRVVDAVSGNTELLQQYSAALKRYKKEERELKQLRAQRLEAEKEYEYRQYQLEELRTAKLKEGMQEELEAISERLENVSFIREQLEYALQVLNDEQYGILTNTTALKGAMGKLDSFGEEYRELTGRINSVFLELDDACDEVRNLEEGLEADPALLEETNARLGKLYDLQKKHGVATVGELIGIEKELEDAVMETEGLEGRINAKESALKGLEKELNTLCDAIRANRKKSIPSLIKTLETSLQSLAMPNARFSIQLHPSETFLENGKDELEFLFAANKGSAFNELKKVASGGELSRIMLVIKALLARFVKLPTMMFDEIDTGVSGEVSNAMAAIMLQMSDSMQVFTITHLPQVAARGHQQFKVYKSDVNGSTVSGLKPLSSQEREEELAEMLGGKQFSDSARAHARQLLEG